MGQKRGKKDFQLGKKKKKKSCLSHHKYVNGFSSIKKKSSFENGPNLYTFFIQKFQASLVNKNETDKVNKPGLFKL